MQFFKMLHPLFKQTEMEPIQLSIPTPCHENWDKMTPNQQGRFCGSCAKTVVDFSAMTDAQLINYFENLKNENVCGRVYPDQLNRDLQKPEPIGKRKKLHWIWQYVAAFVLFFTKGVQVKAQGEIKGKIAPKADTVKKPEVIHVRLGGIRRVEPKDVHAYPAPISQLFIVDENNNPVAGASVQLLPSKEWISTDSSGRINLGIMHAIKEVKVSAIGYENKQVVLKEIKGNSIQLKQQLLTLGEIAIQCEKPVNDTLFAIAGGISVRRADKTSEPIPLIATGKTAPASFSIFPNPVQKGKEISFDVDVKDKKKYKILISDADGKIMLQQNISAASKSQPSKMTIPALWNGGMYIISLVSEKGETIQSEKIMLL